MAGAVQVAGFCLDMATSVLDVKVASNRNKQSEKLLQWSDFFNFNNSNRVYCKWKYINKFPIYHVSACIYLGSWLLQTNILSGIINSPSVTTSRWYLSCCHIAVGFPEKSPPFAGTWAMSVFHRKKKQVVFSLHLALLSLPLKVVPFAHLQWARIRFQKCVAEKAVKSRGSRKGSNQREKLGTLGESTRDIYQYIPPILYLLFYWCSVLVSAILFLYKSVALNGFVPYSCKDMLFQSHRHQPVNSNFRRMRNLLHFTDYHHHHHHTTKTNTHHHHVNY